MKNKGKTKTKFRTNIRKEFFLAFKKPEKFGKIRQRNPRNFLILKKIEKGKQSN
jgi:hypothetical protein